MRFGFHILLTVVMVLSFVGASGEVQAQTTAPATGSDAEPALRLLAERFYHSMESADSTEYLSLWSSQSANDGLQALAKTHIQRTVVSLTISRIKVTGQRAGIRVQVNLKRIGAPPNPKPRPVRGFIGWLDLQTLRCVKEDGAWKVLELVNTVDDVADDLINAETDEARTALLAEQPELVSEESAHSQSLLAQSLSFKADELEQHDFEKSLAIYRLAIQIATQVGDKYQLADLLANIGSLFGSRGDLAQELEYYLKSLEVSDQLGPEERAEHNYLRADIGLVYGHQGNHAQALEWFRRGLNPDNPQAWVLRNIANAYKNLGDYPRALEYFNESLKRAEQMQPNQGRDGAIAGSLTGIGGVYLAQGNYSQALESYEHALRIAEAAQRPGDRGLIPGLLNSLAKLYLLQGNAARAVEFVERAMAMPRAQTEAPGADLEILPTAGRAYLATGLKDRARQVLDKAIAGSEFRRSHAAGGEQDRQRYFEQLVAPYHEMIRLLISEKSDVDAFGYAERSKARALLDVLASGRVEINKAMTAAEQDRDRDLRYKVSGLNRELEVAKQNPRTDPARIKELESSLEKARLEYEAFQTNLYAVHPDLRATRGELKAITLPETREFLPDSNTALLEYVVTDETTYLFVLTKADTQSPPTLRVYPIEIRRQDLGDQVERYRDTLAKRDPDFLKPARELFALLLGPAQAQLQGKTSLVIVPDDALWDLPFQALQSEQQRFLIENHSLFYAPSLTALREMVKESGKRMGGAAHRLDLLALGNPVTSKKVEERAKAGLMDESLEPLPEAEKQVIALARLYGPAQSKVYTGAAATEDRAKADSPSFRVIEFATHGILNSSSPMYSHLVLSQSGNDDKEDGLLEAWEVMKLDLHADLVVLAACETARGRVGAGEGMIGMSWAFFVAGSPTTVASQWKVDSASTTQLMLEFHQNLKSRMQVANARMSKAKALQMASLKLLKSREYRHPFYWAGFVLVGDGF